MKTLKQLRQSIGVTQKELAKRIQAIRGGGALQGPISTIESNQNSPTISRLKDTLEALGFELRLYVVQGQEVTKLDLESLLGPASRAKDAGEVAGGEGFEPSTDQPVSVAALDP